MQKLTYIQKDDGTYEGQVVDMQNHCPTFKQIDGGLLINQLIDFVEREQDFDLYDDIVEELNENLAEENQYDDSLSYMRDKIFPALDRMCPLNGVKLGTLIGKIIDKKQEEENTEDPIVIESLTQKEIDGLNKTCFSLKVTELGTIINNLILEINGERPYFIYFEVYGGGGSDHIIDYEEDPEAEYAIKSMTFNEIVGSGDDDVEVWLSMGSHPSNIGFNGGYEIKTSNEKITVVHKNDDPNIRHIDVVMDPSVESGDFADITVILKDFSDISKTITIKYDTSTPLNMARSLNSIIRPTQERGN